MKTSALSKPPSQVPGKSSLHRPQGPTSRDSQASRAANPNPPPCHAPHPPQVLAVASASSGQRRIETHQVGEEEEEEASHNGQWRTLLM